MVVKFNKKIKIKNIMEDKTQGEIHKTNIESIDFSGVEFVVD